MCISFISLRDSNLQVWHWKAWIYTKLTKLQSNLHNDIISGALGHHIQGWLPMTTNPLMCTSMDCTENQKTSGAQRLFQSHNYIVRKVTVWLICIVGLIQQTRT